MILWFQLHHLINCYLKLFLEFIWNQKKGKRQRCISLKKTYNKYDLLRTCFSRILATDKETLILQIICLIEQSFLNKITTGSLLNFSFLEVCMYLIASFTCNDTILEIIFILDFSIWILVFSMLNLHFSVNYKAFQSALAFLIF